MPKSPFHYKIAARVGDLMRMQGEEPGAKHLEVARSEIRGAATVRGITESEMGRLLQEVTDMERSL